MVIDERLTIVGSFNDIAAGSHPQRRKHHGPRRPRKTSAAAETAQRTLAGYALSEITASSTTSANPHEHWAAMVRDPDHSG